MSLRLFLPLSGVLVVDFVCFFVSCFLPLCSWIICLCCHFFVLVTAFCGSLMFLSLCGDFFCHFVGALCILWLFSVSWYGFNYVYAIMFVSLW